MQVGSCYRLPGRPKGSLNSKKNFNPHEEMKTSEMGEENPTFTNEKNGTDSDGLEDFLFTCHDDFIDPFHADWPFW